MMHDYNKTCFYYYYIHLTAFFQDNLSKPAPERQTIFNLTGARDDGWQWHQLDHYYANQFLQAICPFCHPTNSIKALKAQSNKIYYCG